MSKTPFSKQCELLGNFAIVYGEDEALDEGWQSFIKTNDVALPLCALVWLGMAKPVKEKVEKYITSTWNQFCTILGLDPNNRYESLKDMFDQSWAKEDE